MIIHKKVEDMKPHEGLEYLYKSKEPEDYTDCVNLWCWECVFGGFNSPFGCKKRGELRTRRNML